MSNPYQPSAEFTPPKRRTWRWILWGCGTVSLVMLVACAGLLFFGYRQVTGQGDVAVEVDRLFQEISAGKAADYYRQDCSAEFKKVSSEKEFVEICRLIDDRLGRLQSRTATAFSVRNFNLTTYVDATYACEFERGKATAHTRFQHANGRWLLLAFRVDSPELVKDSAREKCPHCGGLYQSGARFCPHCGAKLDAAGAGENTDVPPGDSPQSPKPEARD